MSELLDLVVAAHGGADRWDQLTEITAHVAIGGLLWELKGHGGILADTHVTLDPHRERLAYQPFGAPGRRSLFEPARTVIEDDDGRVLAERDDPRAAFAGHRPETPWDELHVVYFSGYAMWNYLTSPFLFTRPGFGVEEIEPRSEHGQTWRRLRVEYPEDIATHSRVQEFCFDESGLLRRHDYAAEVVGGLPAAQLTDGHRTFDGITFPTRRRVFRRQPDGQVVSGPASVTIDVLDIAVR
jgi:hypothetical protein